MKIFFVFLFAFSLTSSNSLYAQIISGKKYEIQLPEEWKGKPKLLFKLARIISSEIPRLADKKECINCDADYEVRFFIFPATIDYIFYHPASSLEFTTIFRFNSYMEVADSSGKVFHRLILNDTSAVHSHKFKLYSRGSTLPPVQNSINQIKDNLLPPLQDGQRDIKLNVNDRILNISSLAQQFDSDEFIKMNRKALTPTDAILWSKIEDILLSYKVDH